MQICFALLTNDADRDIHQRQRKCRQQTRCSFVGVRQKKLTYCTHSKALVCVPAPTIKTSDRWVSDIERIRSEKKKSESILKVLADAAGHLLPGDTNSIE